MSANEGTPDERKLRAVQELLRELPQREGQPCMVPFGPVAFLPGQLVDTNTVFMEHSTAAAAGLAGKPAGPAVGGGQLEELSPVQAAERLQALLSAPCTGQRRQQQQQQQQQPAARQSTAKQGPSQQQTPALQQQQPADAGSGQQLASLVGGQSPENLQALHRALQQLGAALDEQAVASGELPSAEGKEVVDIREEYDEAVHGPLEESSADRARRSAGQGAASSSSNAGQQAATSSSGAGQQAAASSSGAAQHAAKSAVAAAGDQAAEGSSSAQQEDKRQQGQQLAVAAGRGSESVDSFEDLMQRMEELEMAELAAEDWQPPAAAAAAAAAGTAGHAPSGPAAAAPAAAAPAAAAQQLAASGSGGGSGSRARKPGGFKPGFLLGKQLEPRQPSPSARSQQQQQGGGEDAATRLLRQREEEAARRREAAFTGAVVERQPASAAPLAAPVQERQPGLPAQPEPPAQLRQQQPQRVSKFKLRRQGLDD